MMKYLLLLTFSLFILYARDEYDDCLKACQDAYEAYYDDCRVAANDNPDFDIQNCYNVIYNYIAKCQISCFDP